MKYRKLTSDEISQLESQGCSCKNWELVEVAEDFLCSRVRGSSFSGKIRLGRFERIFELPGGMCKQAGIRNVALHNVEVGDDCYVENVHNYIANYRIGSGCFIENIDSMVTDGFSRFGNGVCARVLNETGGREIVLTDKLSSHIAYFFALYRHRPRLAERLRALSLFYAEKHGSEYGSVGKECRIINTGKIEAVRFGEYCRVEGAAWLSNGSVNSTEAAPVRIGSGVRASDFIVSSGARLDGAVSIERCFIGQCTTLANGYVAADSVFFSNCHGENGEACSIFAGPFTVTHHKSSLLIAGLFSFMNAGSGSNQSNHMYKLGPIHQGIMERGAKTASDSYILWPAHIGAFSLVMGRHVFHSDTSDLPFSYLIERKNTTYLSPGVNLRSVGTIRDAQKWPKRDLRKDPFRLDQINYNLLSPYTIQKMFNGLEILRRLKEASGECTDVYSYRSVKIRHGSLEKGMEYYHLAIRKFLGNSIIKRLESFVPDSLSSKEKRCFCGTGRETGAAGGDAEARPGELERLRELLKPSVSIGTGDWVDIAGLIAPKSQIEDLLSGIEAGNISRLGEINAFLERLHANYYEYEWTWAAGKIESYFGTDLGRIGKEEIIRIVKSWNEAVVRLDRLLYEDARKEFSLAVMTSFGADGSERERAMDFSCVRGDFDNNPFVAAVLDHIRVKTELGEDLIRRLSVS